MDKLIMKDAESYVENFAEFEKNIASNGHAWLNPTRRQAISRFEALGFPTTADEEWRFTNIAPLTRTSFALSVPDSARPDVKELERFAIPQLEGATFVLIDGYFAPELSDLKPFPKGAKVMSLREAVSSERDLVEPHIARYAEFQNDAFSALNTAFMGDGIFVYVPKGKVIDHPIHVLYVSTDSGTPSVCYPRNLIVTEESSEVTVVEDYVSLGDSANFSDAVTEIVAGENSRVYHYMIERENHNSYNISMLRIEQKRSSRVDSHSVLLGGAIVRNNVHPVLHDEGADCLLNGLYMARNTQHMDNHMTVEHAAPHCDSRQFYYGILDDNSKGVFSGRIIVHEHAQKTDAKQTNRNLLLSRNATIDTHPQLEIYANDVKCTHGATIGQLDQDALFYLRSRAISESDARRILLLAFAGQSLETMELEPLRNHMLHLVSEWFGQAQAG